MLVLSGHDRTKEQIKMENKRLKAEYGEEIWNRWQKAPINRTQA
jgi:hypothetical protein